MKYRFFVLVLIVATLFVPHAAVAADAGSNTTTTSTPTTVDANTTTVSIDQNTRILERVYVPDRDVARLKLVSDVPQDVFVADSGTKEGVVPTRTVELRPGEPRTIELPVERWKGSVGVSISTQRVLYRHQIDVSQPLIGGPWTAGDARVAAIAGAAAVGVVTLFMTVRAALGRSEEPERIA